MSSPRVLGLVALPALWAAACFGNETTAWSTDLAPIGDNPVSAPAPTPSDETPEVLNLALGIDGDAAVLQARAWVDAPLETAWAAFQEPAVVVDHRQISSYTVEHDVARDYEVSFLTHYVVNDIITVEFELTWKQATVDRDLMTDAPTRVLVVYQKTWGSSLIDDMRGSFELIRRGPNLTEISIVQRLDAAATDGSDIESWTRDLYANVLAHTKGLPLPNP